MRVQGFSSERRFPADSMKRVGAFAALLVAGFCLCGILSNPATAYAAETSPLSATQVVVSGDSADGVKEFQLQQVDGTTYLFLPSGANLKDVGLKYSGSDLAASYLLNGRTWKKDATMAVSSVAVGSGNTWSVPVKSAAGALLDTIIVMRSSAVGSVHFRSDDPVEHGRAFVEADPEHNAKAPGNVSVLDAAGAPVYSGAVSAIKGRGNSTWNREKKPYQIKLASKAVLVKGAEKNKTWLLLANFLDPTLMRNTLVNEIGDKAGLMGCCQGSYVDFWYDGEYRGSYQLCEKVQVGEGRVDIEDMDKANEKANPDIDDLEAIPTVEGTNPRNGLPFKYTPGIASAKDITGGYLIEHESVERAMLEPCWVAVSMGGYGVAYFTVKAPEALSYDEALYLSNLLQDCFDRIASGQNIDDVADADSIATMYWIGEVTKNSDAFNIGSTYFYIPGQGDNRLYAGPVWDYDRALGNFAYNLDTANPVSNVIDARPFGAFLLSNPYLKQAVDGKYHAIRNMFEDLLKSSNPSGIDANAALLARSQELDGVLWWNKRVTNWHDHYPDYAYGVNYMKEWMTLRFKWFDDPEATVSSWNLEDNAQITLNKDFYYYWGGECKPLPTVVMNGRTLLKGLDYKLEYANNLNPGTATVTIVGMCMYQGSSVTIPFEIKKIPITKVTLTQSSYTYTGQSKKPGVAITVASNSGPRAISSQLRTSTTNFTVKYSAGRTAIGTYTVTVTAKGNYTGTVTKQFKVNPPATKFKSVKGASRGFTATWTGKTTAKATGYSIRYATSKSMKDPKYAKVKGASSYKYSTGKKLKASKTYYVQIRTYKVVKGVTYYSAWSTPVKVTTKR